MLHIPILRKGEPYKSLDVVRVPHHQTRELFVEISHANGGLIRRDLLDQDTPKAALAQLSTAELVDICGRAGGHFLDDSLPLGDDNQTPDDYIHQVSATTGLPHVMVLRNMQKIWTMFAEMGRVIDGLTRNLDWKLLDDGFGEFEGRSMSFFARGRSLGVVLP